MNKNKSAMLSALATLIGTVLLTEVLTPALLWLALVLPPVSLPVLVWTVLVWWTLPQALIGVGWVAVRLIRGEAGGK